MTLLFGFTGVRVAVCRARCRAFLENAMLTQHIALVPEMGEVDWSDLSRVSAALQRQATDHLGPIWGVSATVDVFAGLDDVPIGYWPIIVRPHLPAWEQGIRLDDNGQPYAQVEHGAGWSLAASQACLDMLVNPYGSRTAPGPSPRSDQGPVEFLIDVGAPCARLPYAIGEVLVSDFCTPVFFGAATREDGARCSFRHSVCAPYEVLSGGQLCWYDPSSASWWLRMQRDGGPADLRLGKRESGQASLREFVRQRFLFCEQQVSLVRAGPSSDGDARRLSAQVASRARAQQLRAFIGWHDWPDVEGMPASGGPPAAPVQLAASAHAPFSATALPPPFPSASAGTNTSSIAPVSAPPRMDPSRSLVMGWLLLFGGLAALAAAFIVVRGEPRAGHRSSAGQADSTRAELPERGPSSVLASTGAASMPTPSDSGDLAASRSTVDAAPAPASAGDRRPALAHQTPRPRSESRGSRRASNKQEAASALEPPSDESPTPPSVEELIGSRR